MSNNRKEFLKLIITFRALALRQSESLILDKASNNFFRKRGPMA